MIGTRGVRLGVVRPGVYEMQVRALCTAAANLFARGKRPHVEIMIPLVVDAEELRIARGWVRDVLDEIGHPELKSTVVTVGAMIETPRAALTAGALAEHADFFSFGTNDLTQMTYAFSRDDVEAKLLPAYRALGILPANPFAVLDQDGVGELVRIACDAARAAKPTIKLGACGEHAGHPDSAAFLVRLGVDSVSCSPFRVPMARLGVAQALLACGRSPHRGRDDRLRAGRGRWSGGPLGARGPSRRMSRRRPSPTSTRRWCCTSCASAASSRRRGSVASLGAHPAALLDEMIAAGYVNHIEKRDMYNLSPRGKERHEALLDTYAGDSVRAGLAPAVRAFPGSERAVQATVHRLADPRRCAERAQRPGLRRRMRGPPRVAQRRQSGRDRRDGDVRAADRAIQRAPRPSPPVCRDGRHQTFTGVMCESFHDVWMEMHEDLIVMQGIERAEGRRQL